MGKVYQSLRLSSRNLILVPESEQSIVLVDGRYHSGAQPFGCLTSGETALRQGSNRLSKPTLDVMRLKATELAAARSSLQPFPALSP
jgi:hypothetical protein